MLQEFKKFMLRGNVLDLAVAVVIGGAFNKIVTSLVENIIMPLVGIILGGRSFENLALEVGEASVKYGAFIQSIVDFVIIGASLFVIVKSFEKFQKKKEEAPAPAPAPSNEEVILAEIRDILKQK
ncbi:large-conductance mechanosensitive channel [Andreesenia angusta]|uniref:Large-conductance mechanosensitive channel n=1 Tax=Andreesenia angusta TaxID=39480 RepID=A0A1S1V9W6_9FIRM|nr:large-conductance mechanosensitive channel protein MscL [Andreesenia angusta]OHW63215.1 large-conductance mechanosensitive channel [Andreesenia angusta]